MLESKRSFRGDPADVQAVRLFVREALERAPVDLDYAVLIAAEIATNSVRHAPGPFTVIIHYSDTQILLGVSDTSPTGPLLRLADSDLTGGRGLQLVDRLAEEWHVETGPEGKTVWARLRVR